MLKYLNMIWKKVISIGNLIVITTIFLLVSSWVLSGSKVKYGKIKKTNYGYTQEYWLEVWGKRVQ